MNRICLIKVASNIFVSTSSSSSSSSTPPSKSPKSKSASASISRSASGDNNSCSTQSVHVYPWYHGSISRSHAEQILLTKSPTAGDFLVRLSESQGGKFTIVYVSSNRTLKNVLVYNYAESGYGLEPTKEQCAEGHTFEKLSGMYVMSCYVV